MHIAHAHTAHAYIVHAHIAHAHTAHAYIVHAYIVHAYFVHAHAHAHCLSVASLCEPVKRRSMVPENVSAHSAGGGMAERRGDTHTQARTHTQTPSCHTHAQVQERMLSLAREYLEHLKELLLTVRGVMVEGGGGGGGEW